MTSAPVADRWCQARSGRSAAAELTDVVPIADFISTLEKRIENVLKAGQVLGKFKRAS